jgi:hypothetical protein
MRQIALIVLSFVVSAGSAAAQTPEPRGTVGAMLGGSQTWDDEGSLGTGLAIGGRGEWRLFGTTSIEASLDFLTHDRSGGFFEAEGTSAIVGASLVHRFGRATAQPYILGGLHVIRHTGTTSFDGVPTDRESTDFGYHFGGGLAVRVGSSFEIGPEARFFVIQPQTDSDPAWANWIGARVGLRF